MLDNYSIELFPNQDVYPYLYSIKIPYISRWKIKIQETHVYSKSLEKPKYEEWLDILKLEIILEKHPMQKNIEKYFNLDIITQRCISTLENNVIDIKYNMLDHVKDEHMCLYDLYKYNVNGEIIFGECKRVSGGYYLLNTLNISDEIKEYFYE